MDELDIREMDGGKYVVAIERKIGKSTHEVLTEKLPELIDQIRFTLSMRWNDPVLSFSRPIRWLLAFHGEAWLPFSFAGLNAKPATKGLRLSCHIQTCRQNIF